MSLKDLKELKPDKITLILNKWWGTQIPDSVNSAHLRFQPFA